VKPLVWELFRSLKATYYRIALLDFVESAYSQRCHHERFSLDISIVKKSRRICLRKTFMKAGESFLDNPMETPFIPVE